LKIGSFRARMLGIVLGVGVAPLILLGAWFSSTILRGGEALLRERLETTLDREAAALGGAWIPVRAGLLDAATSEYLRQGLEAGRAEPPPELRGWFERSRSPVEALSLRSASGRMLWRSERAAGPSTRRTPALGSPLVVEIPVESREGGRDGTLVAEVSFDALRADSPPPATAGAVVVGFDPGSGAPLLPMPFPPELARERRFTWKGEKWVVAFRPVVDPGVVLAAAAPLTLFRRPLAKASREGTALLVLVAICGVAAAAFLTRRMTASLERLASAAEAVAGGDLERSTGVVGEDEVGRVARAFDLMTRSLRRTLGELAERRSLAAVGEFAAALAHEVRNPLTSIKLDLQEVEERLPPGSHEQGLQRSAIEEIDRLDRTVSGALDVVRTRSPGGALTDLAEVARLAARNARAAFEGRDATLSSPEAGAPPVWVVGDEDSLVRALLNLLRNAAEAVTERGGASISVDVEGEWGVARVRDDGPGIDPALRDRIFEPFFTTRTGGTGLGLAVARRIVVAHGGQIAAEGGPGLGTTVTVRMPLASGTNPAGGDSSGGTERSSPHF